MISNFQISCQLVNEKKNLVDALSHFPVTARWLLNEYEQQCDNIFIDENEDAELLSESTNALSEIKNCYVSACQSISCGDRVLTESRRYLTEALKLYPYTFYDLTRLVEVILYAYTVRTRSDPASTSISASHKESGLIKKRLHDIGVRVRPGHSQYPSLIKTCFVSPENEEFLLLSCDEMDQMIPLIVKSECQWLRSREHLTVANTRLVMFIANQYKGGFLEFDDLVQEGQTGLLKAVDRYNCQLGYKFSTYAGYWIRQAISRALSRSERVVRIPCGQMGLINKVFRIRERLITKLGKEPTVQELADQTDLTPSEINSILTISQTSIAIDDSSEENEDTFSPIDFLEQQVFTHPFRDIAHSDLEKLINKALKLLNPREARVICGHFGVQNDREMTLKEIGNEMNLTRERVRQIQVSALNKIKQYYGIQLAACLP